MNKDEVTKILVNEIKELNLHSIYKSLKKEEAFMDSTIASLTLIRDKLNSVKTYFSSQKIINETRIICKELIDYIEKTSTPVICGYCKDARLRDYQKEILKEKLDKISNNVDELIMII